MLKQRWRYWTCSKVADWLRGEKKPYALEWGRWDEWKKEQQQKRPIRFWLSDTGLDYLQNIVYFPYDIYHTIDCYVRNRWIDKTHMINTGFKPGGYYEIDQKILHGLFTELVDFVEKDLAYMGSYNAKHKYKFKNGRCVEAAYEYFRWASRLKDVNNKGKKTTSQQAITSRKIKKLYEWWTKTRPARIDPYVSGGWSEVCRMDDKELFSRGNDTPVEFRRQNQSLKKLARIEEKYDTEDTNMLIELIKIRHHLWS
jgi:hypothetical protein